MKIFSLGPDEDRRTCWKLVSLKIFNPVHEKLPDYIWINRMRNLHSCEIDNAWQSDVSTRECISESEHFIWKFGSQCGTSFETGRDISHRLSQNCIWKFELTSHLGHFIWQVSGGYIWIWTLLLKIWISVCTSFETEGGISDSSFGYCILTTKFQ